MTRLEREALLVSLNFPPSQIASVHRARHLAKHLPIFGWRAPVLTIAERFHKEQPDPELAALIPDWVEVTKLSALPANITRHFGIGDLALRSFSSLRNALADKIPKRRPDVVFMTGWPFYQMLLAPWIKRRFDTPVVLDFQDPWVSAQGAERPRWSKGGLSHRLAVALEPRALRGASFVTAVSEIQNRQMAARYPWLDPGRMAAIPIGGDPEDFDALKRRPLERPQVPLDPERFHLSYVGTFLPRAGGPVRQLFRALRALRQRRPDLAGRLQLNFIGTSNQPSGAGAHLVAPIAAEEGVSDLVVETPRRVPFLDALHALANSDALLLIGSDEPHYTASKIYPALMSGRPYLAIFHRASSAHEILSAAGGGRAIGFEDAAALELLAPSISKALEAIVDDPERFGRADPAAFQPYTAASVAQRFATVFEACIDSPGVERRRLTIAA